MNLPSLTTDNITEILIKVIEFTKIRQKVLTRNINDVCESDFVPKDVEVEEFSNLLNVAINEHMQSQRLVLCDTENIKFGVNGNFEIKPVIDEAAKELLEKNRDEYIELQVNKLMENSLNQRVAAELLRQKQGTMSLFN